MKKIVNLLLATAILFPLGACDMFKIDNYDAPNASFHGGIKDASTGELVETDIQNGSTIRAYEYYNSDQPSTSALTWVIKQNGEFRNDMVFAANYKIEFINGNFFPFNVDKLEIKKGDNQHDFEVTPYIRVKNANITQSGKKITATFTLEAGKSEVKLAAVRLYAFTDMYVGEQVKFAITDADAYQTFSPAKTIASGETYTLTIDTDKYPINFQYTRNYYFRIGALASSSGVGTVRYNYAPYKVIPL